MKNRFILSMAVALLLGSCNGGNPSSSSKTATSEASTSESSASSTEETSSEETTSSEISSSESIGSSSIESLGFNVGFDVSEHVALTVYTTKNYDVVDTDQNIKTRNGDTGEYCKDGEDSQVNFKLVADAGYEIEAVTATVGTYNKVKWPVDTEVENGFRLTKVTADTVITVTAKNKQEAPEGYKASFALEHCSVTVHIGKDVTTTDTPDKDGNYYTRDKDTGGYTKNTKQAQMNFTVVPDSGYEFVSGLDPLSEAKASEIKFITGTYNKLKNNGDNYYTVTQVSSELVITLTCTLIS